LLAEGVGLGEMDKLLLGYPYLRATRLGGDDWLVSLNARTLVELWKDDEVKPFAESIVSELNERNVSPLFNSLAFGERIRAS